MSYKMSQQASNFFIEKSKLSLARDALRTAMATSAWFDQTDIHLLQDAVGQFGWGLEFDQNGNVSGIEFLAECEGSEDAMFSAIAPYVRDGSYIQMSGEDDRLWRWVFDGMCCKEQTPTITW